MPKLQGLERQLYQLPISYGKEDFDRAKRSFSIAKSEKNLSAEIFSGAVYAALTILCHSPYKTSS
jgi:hypothetical protein